MVEAELTMEEMERQVPELAALAVRNAYDEALKAGLSVLVVQDDILYRVTPDGKKHAIRPVAKSFAVEKGLVINLR